MAWDSIAEAGVSGAATAVGAVGVRPAKVGAKGALPGGKTAEEFEQSIVNLPPGERVAHIKSMVASVAKANGMIKDNKLSKLNGRDVYKARDGNLYAVDTQHGRFEVVNAKNGKHLGEVNFEFRETPAADKAGGHNLKVN
ncbi:MULTISPECIES: colicin E3/pyocin S6 family cytotoxin [Achromobacter]|uniref:Colicin E3/pyocin S6 family cytotoxin n=1 Tax=Achromobacter spanius TaxID=217203 RepID=A0ABY8GNJ8_9BURK|nr:MULTISPECIES: colicin E3/pyocin S6 family cytotoxin [Achromobacter]WAI84522.1 colicin E3/pyocin S6 family cytotoxin [Achromobacter spanius]WEX94606.1 colicin E3/pyocin S6 family cytotoxin [Achromobacter sp. SS2-2022]WFP06230.1 colicin E3/pyocin S6 family cytotoxin [Achromobacter spanius]